MSDMVEPVRETIAERYASLLAACDQLRDFAVDMIRSWGGRDLDEDAPYEQLLAIILSRSLSTYWSAVELARTGFGPQAAMLNRSLFEDMIDAHWITVEPKLAAQRIDEHELHGRMLLADALEAQGTLSADELPTFDDADRKAVDKVFGDYGERSWTGLSIYKRVQAVEHLWEPEEGGRETLQLYRRLVHRENNQILHLSAFSIRAQVRERTDTMLTLPLGPSDVHVEKALIAAFYCLGQLLSLIRDTFDFDDPDGWAAVYDDPFRDIQVEVGDL
jgi:hypothetical protein